MTEYQLRLLLLFAAGFLVGKIGAVVLLWLLSA